MYIECIILILEGNYILEQIEIVNLIIETINSIFSNLFSSIDNNVYSYLDTFTFVDSNIINNSFFEKLLGSDGKNGILYLTDALLLSIIIYYAIRYSYSTFTGNNVEKPTQFVFKMVIVGIFVNSSYFLCEQVLNINYLISGSIQDIGESVVGKDITFSSLIQSLNSVISVGENSFDLFSFDGIIKGFISVGLLNILFSYSLRYIIIQVFVLTTPLAILSLINTSSSWIFKAWSRAFFSLLLLQSFVALILIVMLALDSSNKLLLIGAIYALMRANTFMREILGGVSVDVSSNISSIMASFKT